jgi:hypothetical protein
MSLQRTLAAVVALADAVVAAGVAYVSLGSSVLFSGMLVLGVAMLIDAALCFYGMKYAFHFAIVIALLIIVADVLAGSPLSGLHLPVTILTLLSLAASIVAARSSPGIPEQANPMNLPVFG